MVKLHLPLCIPVDGLDEVVDEYGAGVPTQSIESLRRTLGKNGKLCVSSRPEPLFSSRLKKFPELKLQRLTRDDMRRYVRDRLSASDSAQPQSVS